MMSNHIQTAFSASPCSGCGACVGICPKGAICLNRNAAGFWEAAVDEKLCVECGLCTKACPRFQEADTVNLFELQPMALQSADKAALLQSASGGLGHELAKAALGRGEKVVGVVYDYAINGAVHRVISDVEELPKLAGSKYLQSNPAEAFSQALKLARTEKLTVFGTPCQMAGLAKAARVAGVRENLLLVEIFCHGVPSYKLWESQMATMEKKLGTANLESVAFRDKSKGWHNYRISARAGKKFYHGNRENTQFWLAFFEDVLLNPACMQCTARLEKSAADIRMGDYWGPAFQSRNDGVSLVFAPTDGGKGAVEALIASGAVKALEATNAREALKYQNMAVYPASALHEQAIKALENGEDVGKVIRTYRAKQPIKKKIKRLALRSSALLPTGLLRKLKELKVK